jgi:hypothetical protein
VAVEPVIATHTLPIRERKYCGERDVAAVFMGTIWASYRPYPLDATPAILSLEYTSSAGIPFRRARSALESFIGTGK